MYTHINPHVLSHRQRNCYENVSLIFRYYLPSLRGCRTLSELFRGQWRIVDMFFITAAGVFFTALGGRYGEVPTCVGFVSVSTLECSFIALHNRTVLIIPVSSLRFSPYCVFRARQQLQRVLYKCHSYQCLSQQSIPQQPQPFATLVTTYK